jgi:UTP--glucose-1-phosphate uridylyltransferase
MEVPADRIHLYGCASIAETYADGVIHVSDLVEKPAQSEAPSNLAVIGRYILDPVVFEILRNTPHGKGGEIQLTDALKVMASLPADQGGGVHGVVFNGRRYDTGDRLSWLQSTVQLAMRHPELGADFADWLKQFVANDLKDG